MRLIVRHLTLTVLYLILGSGIAASADDQQNRNSSPGQAPVNLVNQLQPPQNPAQPEGSAVPDLGFSVLRTIGGLGLVLTLIVVGYFGLRKIAPRYFMKSASSHTMKVVETLPMGDRRSISLVEVANSRFLVGNTPHQINLILTLPDSMSLVSETEAIPPHPKTASPRELTPQFKKVYDVEKGRSMPRGVNPLPEDLRMKMRQLRRTLER
jgi:flagellar biosynthetic protein FliO